MKNLKLGSLSIPITQFASQGNAVLGIRDSGKSYSATYLAEQLYASGIPFVAFDPSGVWKFLRVPGAGAGLPVVVAGGKVPDLPLTPQSAPEIVRAAMRANVSLVLDLYDIHMSKADWSRIVESCVRVLLYENGEHGLRHIFIEEAAEFAPQQVSGDKARVYAEVEKLARIGGNALLGYTLINQRAEQVNKAVLELCDCLLLHRQKGKNSLNSLSKWLEYSQGGDTKEIIKGLPTLPSGECWVWPAGADHATHVKMPQKNTFHPDRRALIANPAAANVKRIDASRFVAELRGSLEKYVEEAKANDPAELKKQLADLKRQVAAKAPPQVDQALIKRREDDAFQNGHAVGKRNALEHAATVMQTIGADIAGLFQRAITQSTIEASKVTGARPENPVRRVEPVARAARLPESAPKVARARQIDGRAPSAEIGAGGKRRIMTALAQNPEGITQRKLSILVDIAPKGGTWRTYMAELRGLGYIDGGSRDLIKITDAGLTALGDFEPLPTGDALVDYWRQRLGNSGKRAIFDAIVAVYPDSITVEDVSDRTNIAREGGTWRTYMAELRGLGIIEGRGELRASADLF